MTLRKYPLCLMCGCHCVICAHRSLYPTYLPVFTRRGSLWKRQMQSSPKRETLVLLRCLRASVHVSGRQCYAMRLRGYGWVAFRPSGDSHPKDKGRKGDFCVTAIGHRKNPLQESGQSLYSCPCLFLPDHL